MKKIIDGYEYIWSDVAIDYSKGTTPAFYNSKTKEYVCITEEIARALPKDISKYLVNKPNKIGTWVLSSKGLRDLARDKGWV